MTIFNLQDNVEFTNKPIINKMGETPFSKEIQICMGQGAFMKEHSAPGAITIELFSGAIELSTPDESHEMKVGEIAFFKAKVPHSLVAKEDSIIRLSLCKSDTFQRVENLIRL